MLGTFEDVEGLNPFFRRIIAVNRISDAVQRPGLERRGINLCRIVGDEVK